MGLKLYNESDIQNIATSIRSKNGSQSTYTVSQMSTAIDNIPSGSSIPSYPLNNGKNNIWVVIDTPNQSVSIEAELNDTIDWGDGTTSTVDQQITALPHTYSTVGIYCISAISLQRVVEKDLILYIEYNNHYPYNSGDYTNSTIKKARLNFSRPLSTTDSGLFTDSFLKEISMPYVTTISEYAFKNTYLTSVDLSNITDIGISAFENTKLTSVTLPSSTALSPSAFANNTSLTTLTLNGDRDWSSNATSLYFDGCSNLTTLNLGGVLTLSNSDTNIPKILTTATISSGVTSIGAYCFYNQTNLTSVTIPNSVTSIGDSAFRVCTSLTSVTLPNSVTTIGASAFYGCYTASFTIPNTITTIGQSAFYDCSNLTSFDFTNITSIGNEAFSGSTSRGSGLLSVTLPSTITTIGTNVFRNSHNLTTVNINCNIPTTVTGVFSKCTSLQTVTVGANVTALGNSTFTATNNTYVIHLQGTTPPALGSSKLASTPAAIYVPAESVETYQTTSYWSDYASIIQAEPVGE